MNNTNMFELIDLLNEAKDKAADHYLKCDQCQKYTYDLNIPKCDTGFELDREVEKVEIKIEAYKIDIY